MLLKGGIPADEGAIRLPDRDLKASLGGALRLGRTASLP